VPRRGGTGGSSSEHLYDEHELDQNFVRLNAGRRVLYRTRQKVERPVDAPNYFDGTPDPV